jgi:hypothetical protein
MLSSKEVTLSKTDLEGVLTQALELTRPCSSEVRTLCIGEVVYINEKRQPFIDYPGNRLGAIIARSIVDQLPIREEDSREVCPLTTEEGAKGDFQGSNKKASLPVLLFFENGDPSLPVIIGIVHSAVKDAAPRQEVVLQAKESKRIVMDGETLLLDAQEEITLRCGKSSVTLKKDGKIVLKGTDIVSRASRTNKIKGASVAVN